MHKTLTWTLLAFPALLAFTACPNMTGAHKAVAEEEAQKWANELGMELKSVSCVAKDTDGDGYVSCTLMLNDGSTKGVECAGARGDGTWIRNSGCRDPKLGMGAQ